MDSKHELLNVKQESMELMVDTPMVDSMNCMQQESQKKVARGK